MTERSINHASFVITRHYPAAPAQVFQAFADTVIRRRWFIEGEGWTVDEFTADFAEGGRERSRFRFGADTPMSNDTVYHEILPNQRIVFSYAMTIGGKRISVSLATIEITAEGTGTRLVYTEQAAFLDGADRPADREAGSRELLEALAAELGRQPAGA
ncbi:SRPBCC family protein [Phreatobacter stygius]|uniref:Polyketide cyclase n=1 Tax=Phreatobacter stygius TaxID=1940610 RepID=A0A4D7BB42_9HYPH|nr:SRPBCC family protein [Phreatobacter stygius]QCI67985.1 polyketide cyclase [Phreatobacter stygius]